MPAPAIMIDRATVEDVLIYGSIPPTLVSNIRAAIEAADREYDQAKAYAAEQNAALKS